MLACRFGHSEIAKLLLRTRILKEKAGRRLETDEERNLGVGRQFIVMESDFDEKGEKEDRKIDRDYEKVFDVNEKGPDGWTALMFAAAGGYLDIVSGDNFRLL